MRRFLRMNNFENMSNSELFEFIKERLNKLFEKKYSIPQLNGEKLNLSQETNK